MGFLLDVFPLVSVDPTGHDSVQLHTNPEEIDHFITAIDLLLSTYEDSSEKTVLELLLENVIPETVSGLTGVAIEQYLASLGIASIGTIPALILGIVVGVVVSAAIAWNDEAVENAMLTLNLFQQGLQGAKDAYENGDAIYINIDSTFLSGDNLYIHVDNPDPFIPVSYMWKKTTGIMNKAGAFLVDMFIRYADQYRGRDNPITYTNFWGTSFYISNYDWRDTRWPSYSKNPCNIYGEICSGFNRR